MEFVKFRDSMRKHFADMCKGSEPLFTTDVDPDELYEVYLDAFPPEMNPVYKTRRVFDCSACRHFLKQVGGVVTLKDGVMTTLWGFKCSDPAYAKVAKALDTYVKGHSITGIYVTKETNIGHDHDTVLDMGEGPGGKTVRHDHFHVTVPSNLRFSSPDTARGQAATKMSVFKRAMEEIPLSAIDTVLELIDSNTLYRGTENRALLVGLKTEKVNFDKLTTEDEKVRFAWERSVHLPSPLCHIRNSSIGTLLVNISEGMDLDDAVTQYERITAPANYKRPKAIFTQKMLDDAKKKITELGYMDSLPRRFAVLNDITVQDILFVDRDVSKKVFGVSEAEDLFGDMEKSIPVQAKKFSRAEEIGIDDFVSRIIPTANKMEVLLESKLTRNMVSLIAPKNRDAKSMFKWNNPFSWAYAGNMTDSDIRQNVKNAGGRVDGVLRFSIQWNDLNDFDANDLDAHCSEPMGHIFFGHREVRSGGNLDVDIINPSRGIPAVENITWPVASRMMPGEYNFSVHCFTYRGGHSGFRAEIEFNGQVYRYDYTQPLRNGQTVDVATVLLDKNGNFSIQEKLTSSMSSREVWGLHTNQFVPVSVIMNSPNYWAGEKGIGAKHTFFMLDGCRNDERPNPFFNEFLCDELGNEHKRVMEALGSKAHVEDSEDQLSGIGFSHTQRGEVTVKVHGSTERVFKVKF